MRIFFPTILLVALCVSAIAGPGPKPVTGDPVVKSYRKLADSLFSISYQTLPNLPWEKMQKLMEERSTQWEKALAAVQGLSADQRTLLAFYGKTKKLGAKTQYIYYNPWAKDHEDALSDWTLEGMNMPEPGMELADFNLAYAYIRPYLDVKVGVRDVHVKYSSCWFPGRLDQYKFLLLSDCPEKLKFEYLDGPFRKELDNHRVSPEILALEPWIRKGFKDPAILHHYDSLIKRYHLLDKGQPGFDFTMRDANGRTRKLSDFRGKKLVIDTWATWCSSCIAKMPNYDSLAKANKDPNIVFITFSIDTPDSSDWSIAWRNYVAAHHMDPATSFMAGEKDLAAMRDAYGITEVPHYFIFDREGRIVTLHSTLPWDPQFLWYLKD